MAVHLDRDAALIDVVRERKYHLSSEQVDQWVKDERVRAMSRDESRVD
jgi:hypothetical protein